MRVNYQLSRLRRGSKENRAGEGYHPGAEEQGEKSEDPNETLRAGHFGKSRKPCHRAGRGGLCTELVLLDFHGGQTIIKAHDTAARDQFEGAFIVELGRPADS